MSQHSALTPKQRRDAWHGFAILAVIVLAVGFLIVRPHLHDIFYGDEPRALCPSGYPEPCATPRDHVALDEAAAVERLQAQRDERARELCGDNWQCQATHGLIGGWVMVEAGGGLPSDILVWDGEGHCQLLNHPNVSLYGTEFEWMEKCIKGPGR